MRTKYWIILLAAVLAVCLISGILLLTLGSGATCVQVYSDGKLLHTLPLGVDTRITVQSKYGENVITVQQGKVAVTEADCPDGYCMHRGWCDGGAPVVCLPNRLVLRFSDSQKVDAALN